MSRPNSSDVALMGAVLALVIILTAAARNLASQQWTFLDDRPAPVRWSGR